jgi:hypothetical protein
VGFAEATAGGKAKGDEGRVRCMGFGRRFALFIRRGQVGQAGFRTSDAASSVKSRGDPPALASLSGDTPCVVLRNRAKRPGHAHPDPSQRSHS